MMLDPAVAAAAIAAIPASERYGPWAADLCEAERRARLRSLQAITRLLTGARGVEMCAHLARAEHDPAALVAAHGALNRLASRDRREVLTSFAALARAA